MRISIVLPGGGRSGGVRSTVIAANGLLARGHDVRLLVYQRPVTLRGSLRKIYHRICFSNSSDWLDLYQRPIQWFRDIREVNFEENEIILASCWWASTEIRKLTEPKLCKVHHVRGVTPNADDMKRSFGEKVPKIVIASYLIPILEQTCGQTPCAVIHNGVDLDKFYPSCPEERRTGVGTIYSSAPVKDPQVILGVLRRLRELEPDVPQKTFSAMRRPPEIPICDFYRLPSIDKIRDIYSSCKVWFLASRSEGLSNPVMEAMACGCAVVATDCGGPQDLIEDGYNGFIVPVGHIEELTEKIRVLLHDPKLASLFSQRSREKMKYFSWEHSINKLEDVLTKIYQDFIIKQAVKN